MPRGTKKQRKAQEYGYYLVEITGWNWSYHLGLNQTRWEDDPLFETQTIEVLGRLIGPASAGCERANVHLAPQLELNAGERLTMGKAGFRAVGSVQKRGDTLDGYIPLPQDALAPLVSMFSTDRFRYLLMYGPRLFRSKALLTWFALETFLDLNDYPLDYS